MSGLVWALLMLVGAPPTSDDPRSTDVLTRACARRDAEACWRLGVRLRDAPEHELEAAASALGAACDGKVHEACVALGQLRETGDGVTVVRDPRGALALFDQACRAGDPAGCSEAGRMLRMNRDLPPDPARARTLWESACKAGHTPACVLLAGAEGDGWGAPPNPVRRLALLDGACQARDTEGCRRAAFLRARGVGDAAPDVRARAELEAACRDAEGEPLACVLLGALVQLGRATATERTKPAAIAARFCVVLGEACTESARLDLLGRAGGRPADLAANALDARCQRSDPRACAWLGQAYSMGRGRARDLGRAAELFRDACARGDAEGCNGLGTAEVVGAGMARDAAHGLGRLEAVCDGGFARACDALAQLYGRADLVGAADPDKVRRYHERACRLGLRCAKP